MIEDVIGRSLGTFSVDYHIMNAVSQTLDPKPRSTGPKSNKSWPVTKVDFFLSHQVITKIYLLQITFLWTFVIARFRCTCPPAFLTCCAS